MPAIEFLTYERIADLGRFIQEYARSTNIRVPPQSPLANCTATVEKVVRARRNGDFSGLQGRFPEVPRQVATVLRIGEALMYASGHPSCASIFEHVVRGETLDTMDRTRSEGKEFEIELYVLGALCKSQTPGIVYEYRRSPGGKAIDFKCEPDGFTIGIECKYPHSEQAVDDAINSALEKIHVNNIPAVVFLAADDCIPDPRYYTSVLASKTRDGLARSINCLVDQAAAIILPKLWNLNDTDDLLGVVLSICGLAMGSRIELAPARRPISFRSSGIIPGTEQLGELINGFGQRYDRTILNTRYHMLHAIKRIFET